MANHVTKKSKIEGTLVDIKSHLSALNYAPMFVSESKSLQTPTVADVTKHIREELEPLYKHTMTKEASVNSVSKMTRERVVLALAATMAPEQLEQIRALENEIRSQTEDVLTMMTNLHQKTKKINENAEIIQTIWNDLVGEYRNSSIDTKVTELVRSVGNELSEDRKKRRRIALERIGGEPNENADS